MLLATVACAHVSSRSVYGFTYYYVSRRKREKGGKHAARALSVSWGRPGARAGREGGAQLEGLAAFFFEEIYGYCAGAAFPKRKSAALPPGVSTRNKLGKYISCIYCTENAEERDSPPGSSCLDNVLRSC